MPPKAKHSKKRLSGGTLKSMPHASTQGHSTSLELPLQPLNSAQPFAPTITQIPPSNPIAQKLASPSDPQFHKMPHKTKHSKKRVRHRTSNLISHASSQMHSKSKPSLRQSKAAQPRPRIITIIPPSIRTPQNMVSPSDLPSRALPRKVKVIRSKKRESLGISNSMHQASSQGHSIHVEPPLQSELAQHSAATSTLIPPSNPIVQDTVSLLRPASRTKPRTAKYSNKKLCRGISNLLPLASSQGHSTSMEPKPLMTTRSRANAITFIPPSIPIDAPSSVPRKPKLLRERASLGISNFMPHASAQGHSSNVETPQQYYQSCAPSTALIPPPVSTAQNMVSLSDPPLRAKSRRGKLSRERASLGISNLMSDVSSLEHSAHVAEQLLQLSQGAQSCAPTATHVPSSIPTTQNLVSPLDPPLHAKPRKGKLSRQRASLGISNLMADVSSHGHSTHVAEPLLQSSQVAQSCAPTTTIVSSSMPTAQNLVLPSDPLLHAMPAKDKLSKEGAFHGISSLLSHALPQGHSTYADPLPQPSQVAQGCAPTATLVPTSIPTTQKLPGPSCNANLSSFQAMPGKANHSKKKGFPGIVNLMSHASPHGHSTQVAEPLLSPSQVAQFCAPTATLVSLSIPTAQKLVSPSDPSLHAMPGKVKHSKKRGFPGIANLMSHASPHGLSTDVTDSLLQVAQTCAPTTNFVPSSIPTAQKVVSPLDPSLHGKLVAMPGKAKHSQKRGYHGISNLMSHASPQGHSTPVEPPLPPSELAQSPATTVTHIPSSIPSALGPLALSETPLHVPSQKVFSGILNLMHHACNQGDSIPLESNQQPLKPSQPCPPAITDVPTLIPTAEDLISPLDLPSCLRPRTSKHSKKRASSGISNFKPRASSQGRSVPMEPPQQPLELEKPPAPPVIPSSVPTASGPVSGSPLNPSQYPVSGSPSDPSQDQVSCSPPDSPQDPVSSLPSDPSFVPPSTLTQQLLAPEVHPYSGREWTVQAIDEHGNTTKIQVTKRGVFRMPPGQQIVVPFDRQLRAFGEAAKLLSSACGQIATDSKSIPINFDSWPKVPKSYKDDCFNILKTLFHFEASESIAKRYCLLTLSKKYRSWKLDLWTRTFDPSLSKEQLIAKVPDGIEKDQWLTFVDNHLKPEYQEKLTQEKSKSAKSAEVSVDDTPAKVLGEDHSGHVPHLGLGDPHSVGFKSSNESKSMADAAESSQLKEEILNLKSELAASEKNLKTLQRLMLAYIQMKEGLIPPELGALIEHPNQADEPSGQDMTTSKSKSS